MELFGNLSPAYISENYEEIFDISAGEIDEGFLAVVTSEEMRGWQSSQATLQRAGGTSEISLASDLSDDPYEELFGPIPEPETLAYEEADAPVTSVTSAGALRSAIGTGSSIGSSSASTTSANSFTSITYASKTNTSVTFTIWYVNSSNVNNYLEKYDTGTQTWSYLLGQGQAAATSRSYTATGLRAGGVYKFRRRGNGTGFLSDIMIIWPAFGPPQPMWM